MVLVIKKGQSQEEINKGLKKIKQAENSVDLKKFFGKIPSFKNINPVQYQTESRNE